jgi:hypothetical protein
MGFAGYWLLLHSPDSVRRRSFIGDLNSESAGSGSIGDGSSTIGDSSIDGDSSVLELDLGYSNGGDSTGGGNSSISGDSSAIGDDFKAKALSSRASLCRREELFTSACF